jgi:Ni/Co efflux regulator RcnB
VRERTGPEISTRYAEHWVQTGGDYVLVAIATSILMQLMLNN